MSLIQRILARSVREVREVRICLPMLNALVIMSYIDHSKLHYERCVIPFTLPGAE